MTSAHIWQHISQHIRPVLSRELTQRIFLIFWMKLGLSKGKKVTMPDFPKKIPDHSKITRMCHFRRFFEIFSETLLTIFPIFSLKVALSSAFQPAKAVCQNKFLFLRYLRSKLDHSIGEFEVFREYLGNAANDFDHFHTKSSP